MAWITVDRCLITVAEVIVITVISVERDSSVILQTTLRKSMRVVKLITHRYKYCGYTQNVVSIYFNISLEFCDFQGSKNLILYQNRSRIMRNFHENRLFNDLSKKCANEVNTNISVECYQRYLTETQV